MQNRSVLRLGVAVLMRVDCGVGSEEIGLCEVPTSVVWCSAGADQVLPSSGRGSHVLGFHSLRI